jgi:quercetin dioxygenase-like cupin family protein
MSDMNRRDLGIALAAFASLATLRLDGQSVAEPRLAHSRIFAFGDMPQHPGPNGMITRSVMRGTLATGEYVEVHETMLPAGQMPHPPHRHTHSEFLLIREGMLEVDSDGQKAVVRPGDVVFTASAVLHGLKNVGEGPASYFVVAVGEQRAVE